jgi:hypothetical protein
LYNCVTKALKKSSYQKIIFLISGYNEKDRESTIPGNELGVTVTVEPRPIPYAWIALIAAFVGTLMFFIFRKKKPKAAPPKVYFSYKWNNNEAFVTQLYNSLLKDGFLLQIDKKDMDYKDSITNFMSEIGDARYIIVVLSKDYLKSWYCMYELFQIYLGAGMEKAEFQKRLFPIHLEDVNIDDLEEVNSYTDYWEQEAADIHKLIIQDPNNVNTELAKKKDFLGRLINDNGNLLAFLSDINALDITTLLSTDFKNLKKALHKAIEEAK